MVVYTRATRIIPRVIVISVDTLLDLSATVKEMSTREYVNTCIHALDGTHGEIQFFLLKREYSQT
jgi:hypothetical protein